MAIIGAGHAAVRAAVSMRDAGYEGSITMVAEEGVSAPYERPPLSKWNDDGVAEKLILPGAQLNGLDVSRVSARVTSVDPGAHEVTLGDGQVVAYDRLLLATGASARRLDPALTGGADIFYLRDKSDAQNLRAKAKTARSAIIIGGGFIGLELAASLREMGLEVHVFEAAERLLSRAITAPVAQMVQDLHSAKGVSFHFNTKLSSVHKSGTITLVDGSNFSADLIVAGVGSEPNVLLAEQGGLSIANGIKVDTHLRTSDEDIFSAGDCCAFPLYGPDGTLTRLESWQAAGELGSLAGRNMVMSDQANCTLTPWFWSEQYDHVLQVSGLTDPQLERVERAYSKDHHISFGITSIGKLAYACGIAAGTKVAKDIRLTAKMIEADVTVKKTQLEDISIPLKTLLRG